MANVAETFKVMVLGGLRQVGKSTLMRRFLSGNGVCMVSFDNPTLFTAAVMTQCGKSVCLCPVQADFIPWK